MKIPLRPLSNPAFFQKVGPSSAFFMRILDHIARVAPVTPKGDYLHWDKIRHLSPPDDLSVEEWWSAIKMARQLIYQQLPFHDFDHKPFVLAMPELVLQKLHAVDHACGNTVQSAVMPMNAQLRDTYLVRSLMEEAITSSQLEGASTTRQVAKHMLQTQRKPRDLSEQMIFNNYQAMQFIRDMGKEKLTPAMILELHRILTKDTLENSASVGQLRITDDIYVYDDEDQVLHTPPKAAELQDRLEKLCSFANQPVEQGKFFHPVLKAILLHFALAYDHPFIDGNGRTARALFYWSMAHQGYWLMEFISLSKPLNKNHYQYLRAFLYTETDGNDFTYFAIHQLGVIIKAIDELREYIGKKEREIKEIEEMMAATSQLLHGKLNYRQISLIKHALKNSTIHFRIEAHRQMHNVTYDTARTDLLALTELGFLIKNKVGKAFVFFVPNDLKERITNSINKSGDRFD